MADSCLRVVLAENSLTETGLTLRSLCAETGSTLELVTVGRGEDLARVLGAHRPDIALLKLAMLQPDAGARLRVLQQNTPSIPFILLTEPADKLSAEICLDLGAADYLVEGYLDERTMKRALGAAIAEKKRAANKVKRIDFYADQYDPQGGWAGGGEHDRAFKLVLGSEERARSPIGTEMFEQLVSEIAKFLRRNLRSTDGVKRTSANELVVSVEGINAVLAEKRIKEKLRSWRLGCGQELDLEIQFVEVGRRTSGFAGNAEAV